MPVALAAGYAETYGAVTDCPERALWLAVLTQAVDDLFGADEQNRRDAWNFFMADDLIEVLNYAGISTSCVPTVRERARAIYQRSGRQRGLVFQGQTRTVREWSEIIGLTPHTIVGRLRMGWPVEKALTAPIKNASGHSRKRKIQRKALTTPG